MLLWCAGAPGKETLGRRGSPRIHRRQQQLHASGRLAAQIAHQIKNPLSIINNAAFSLQRAIQQGKNSNSTLQQTEIIREEIDKTDRIITRLMGYAQLAEGKVEKLNTVEEINRAITEVFPAGAWPEMRIDRDFKPRLPALLMQRTHLSEILINILQNAREAMAGRGRVWIKARQGENETLILSVRDQGPGIAADHLEKIFQPYFTTKDKGTGLGLAIVRNNAEMYGGSVRVQSELGKGTVLIVELPTRTFMKVNS